MRVSVGCWLGFVRVGWLFVFGALAFGDGAGPISPLAGWLAAEGPMMGDAGFGWAACRAPSTYPFP